MSANSSNLEGLPKEEPTQFRVSPVAPGYDNPLMVNKSEKEIDDVQEAPSENTSRRSSRISDYFGLGRSGEGGGVKLRASENLKLPNDPNAGFPGRRGSRLSIFFFDFFRKDPLGFDVPTAAPYFSEAAPRLENYRDTFTAGNFKARPTLDELHYDQAERRQSRKLSSFEEPQIEKKEEGVKFGWIKGVLIRCLLNIWGVMLFLRMGWMTGQAGIILSIVVIVLSAVFVVITTLSMSAICTNGEIKGGGAYYLVSRNLGPEFGGAVGIMFTFANIVAGSMYVIGAAETVRDLLQVFDVGLVEYPSAINDVRVSGIILLLMTMCVTVVGMEFENRTQLFLLVLLILALMDYFVGACLPPTLEQKAKGFIGWDWNTGIENMMPNFRGEQFFTVFAVFFPSVTGILAGANISGDLKDASSAIPKGTLWSIVISSITYAAIVIWLGFTTVRDSSGIVAEVLNNTFRDCANRHCSYGLMNHYQTMEMSSGYGPLIYAGIFAATLSSALASLISAPRIFQAVCADDIFPFLKFFEKGYGKDNDPRRATVLVFVVALLFTIIAELNSIAPIISNFFMATYGLINLSCFHSSFVESPGFRPSFKYYNKWLSLVGGILCVIVMFIMDWIIALVTFIVAVAIWVFIYKANLDINWGTSQQGYYFKNAMTSVIKLNKVEEHVKNYRPEIIALTGNPGSRAPLVDFCNLLTKKTGLSICGHVVTNKLTWQERTLLNNTNTKWLDKRGTKSFYTVVEANCLSEGAHSMLQCVGFGKLKPNILLMGYKLQWQECDHKDLLDYFNLIHEAFDMHISLAILRLPKGINFCQYFENERGFPIFKEKENSHGKNEAKRVHKDNIINLEMVTEEPATITATSTTPQNNLNEPEYKTDILPHEVNGNSSYLTEEIPPDVMDAYNYFQQKQKGTTIDVWWLYDDGGLTMLLPYLLTSRSKWRACKLRVFAVAQKEEEITQEQVNMAALLHKFRIQYSDVLILSTANLEPTEESKKNFQNITSKWVVSEGTAKGRAFITKADLLAHKNKTNSHLCLRELLEQHSTDASLIVMTLPLPKKDSCPAPLFMAWLEVLTDGMPPVLFVRGNQSSVLTFYS